MILRPATAADAEAVATVYLASRAAGSPNVRWAHGEADVRAWLANHLIPHGGMTVAVDGKTLHGYIALHEHWVDHLYLHPISWRRGLGSRLINHAKQSRPTRLHLWTFQSNTPARAFYEHHGFTIDHLTDGADNEENEPDVLYVWQGKQGSAGQGP